MPQTGSFMVPSLGKAADDGHQLVEFGALVILATGLDRAHHAGVDVLAQELFFDLAQYSIAVKGTQRAAAGLEPEPDIPVYCVGS